MEKQEVKDITKGLSALEKAIVSHTKETAQLNRKLDILNSNLVKLYDKLGTHIQLMQNNGK